MSQPSPLAVPMPWNLVASAYTAELVPSFEEFAGDALRLAGAPKGARLVDVACGPGSLALLAAKDGYTVDALDFSTAMIEKLEGRKAAAGGTTVTAQVGDGQALPYVDGTFAAGFSMFGLMFFPDRAKGLAELRRVLAPGGRAVIGSWTRIEDVPAMAAMFASLRSTMKILLGDAAPAPGNQEMPLSTEELCRAEMAQSFADVEVHRVSHPQQFPTSDAFFGQLERTMAPLVLMRQRLGEDKWTTISTNAKDALRSVLGSGPAEVGLTALITVGTAR
ncbi:MAG TPA: methyltransferase domain-containing protein [Kofleriaceae bacterium]|nr:methyltransferase domain-containing protein [Kofleriaceae bacterium]